MSVFIRAPTNLVTRVQTLVLVSDVCSSLLFVFHVLFTCSTFKTHFLLFPYFHIFIASGAIFEGDNQDLETAFRRAVDRVNIDRTLLSRSRLEASVVYIKSRDSFHAAKVG